MLGRKMQMAVPQGGELYDGSLLLHCDGANGGTDFVDSSVNQHVVTPLGVVTTDTASPKFGSASALFGAGGYLSVPHHGDFNFGTGDYSIDFWFFCPNAYTSTYMVPITKGQSVAGWLQIYFAQNSGAGTNALNVLHNGPTASQHSYFNAPIVGWLKEQWNHFEISRTSGQMYAFYNGVLITKNGAASGAISTDSTIPLFVGKDSGTSYMPLCKMDEVRIMKGTYGHTSNFTPPTTPY